MPSVAHQLWNLVRDLWLQAHRSQNQAGAEETYERSLESLRATRRRLLAAFAEQQAESRRVAGVHKAIAENELKIKAALRVAREGNEHARQVGVELLVRRQHLAHKLAGSTLGFLEARRQGYLDRVRKAIRRIEELEADREAALVALRSPSARRALEAFVKDVGEGDEPDVDEVEIELLGACLSIDLADEDFEKETGFEGDPEEARLEFDALLEAEGAIQEPGGSGDGDGG